jgi:hypothetical protein
MSDAPDLTRQSAEFWSRVQESLVSATGAEKDRGEEAPRRGNGEQN